MRQLSEEDEPNAVFWNTHNHQECFDSCGDLAGNLFVNWGGDPDLITDCLLRTGLAVKKPRSAGTTFILHPADTVGSTDEVTVVLESAGDNLIPAVKALRTISAGLSIVEARRMMADVPRPVLTKVDFWDALEAQERLRAAGARATLHCDCAVRATTG